MTCAKCEALRDEVAFLKSELARARDLSRIACFREEFDLSPRAAALLNALYNAAGEVLLIQTLRHLILEDRHDGENLLRVYIGRLRKALGDKSVLNVRGAGYRLSPAALARIEAVLSGDALATVPERVAA